MSKSQPEHAAGYRERLYSTYVSQNKEAMYAQVTEAKRAKNARDMLWGLAGWLPEPRTGARVVDLGCGPGNLLAAYKRFGYRDVLGVDISEEQLKIAQRVTPTVVLADAFEFLEATSEAFDLISAFDLLEHLTRDEALRFLDLVRGALRPGGVLLLQTPNGDSPFAGSIVWSDLTHETQFTAISLTHILGACGFTDVAFRESGPTPLTLPGQVRLVIWKVIRLGLIAYHLVETGGVSTNLYTRVIRCRARRGS